MDNMESTYALISADRKPVLGAEEGVYRQTETLEMIINQYYESIILDIINISRYDIILGTMWLQKHNPRIN